MALANLRGVRESGRLFAAPYLRLRAAVRCPGRGGLGTLGSWATWRPVQDIQDAGAPRPDVFLVLAPSRAGCAAMTGTEAIANAVPDFKPPESKNAAQTLGIMAGVLGFLLLGVTALSQIINASDAGRHGAQPGRARRIW